MSIKIISIKPSTRKDKKFMVRLSNNKIIHFGLKNSRTYVQGASKQTRDAYIARHSSNPLEKKLIEYKIMSPALLSYYLLWNTPSLKENIKILNSLL